MAELKHITGVVTKRSQVGPDLWVIRVRPASPISFLAGQYVTIGLPLEGKIVERPYSMASAPDEAELEFFVERVEGGRLTPTLHEVPEGGEVLLRTAVKGRFLLDTESGRPNQFMTATVTGVAPFVSMVRDLVARPGGGAPGARVLLLQGASVPSEFGYDGELAECANRFQWLTYVPTISRPRLAPEWKGERGRVEDVVRKYLDGAGFTPSNTTAYACGNPGMIRAVEAVLSRAGFERAFIREEMYWPGD